jgi:hypothetical protein
MIKLTLEHQHVVAKMSGFCSHSGADKVGLHMMRMPVEEDTALGKDKEDKLVGTEKHYEAVAAHKVPHLAVVVGVNGSSYDAQCDGFVVSAFPWGVDPQHSVRSRLRE